MSQVTQLGPSGGNVTFLSSTGNIEAAMFMVIDYLNSTYSLQAADTVLEQKITTQEAQFVQAFQQSLISGPNDYITQIEQLTPAGDPNNYGTDMQKLIQLYTNANTQNQSLVKVMDGNNSTAQNTLSQNSQGQQGDIQTLSSINGVSANLTRLIQG